MYKKIIERVCEIKGLTGRALAKLLGCSEGFIPFLRDKALSLHPKQEIKLFDLSELSADEWMEIKREIASRSPNGEKSKRGKFKRN